MRSASGRGGGEVLLSGFDASPWLARASLVLSMVIGCRNQRKNVSFWQACVMSGSESCNSHTRWDRRGARLLDPLCTDASSGPRAALEHCGSFSANVGGALSTSGGGGVAVASGAGLSTKARHA